MASIPRLRPADPGTLRPAKAVFPLLADQDTSDLGFLGDNRISTDQSIPYAPLLLARTDARLTHYLRPLFYLGAQIGCELA